MHPRFTTRVGLAALLCALGALPAAAQQQEQTVEFQSYRVPGWSLTPSVAFGAIYDSNVALSAPRASLGDTQADAFVNIVPGGQLEFIGKRTDFSANYRGFIRRYVEVDGLDGFDQRASLHLKHALSRRLTFFARDSFSDSPTTDEVELNGVPYRRTGSRSNTFGAGTDLRITKFTTWSARYDNTWVDFERPDIVLVGGWIHALRNELSHQLSEHVAIGGEHTFRMASLDDGRRDLTFQDAGGVLRFALGPHTTASAAGGFAMLHDRIVDTTRSGAYYRVGLTHALERATLGTSFERHYVPSFGFGGASSSQELRGFVQMPLGRTRVYTQASGTWRRTMPFEAAVLELDTVAIRSLVGYAAARWARIETLYTYTRQDSIVTGGEIDRHRAGVQFVVSQPMRMQ